VVQILKVVGVGPGSRDYLTSKAIELISKAEVVSGFKRALEVVEHLINGKKIVELEYRTYLREIKKLCNISVSKEVVILSTGDPMFSGLGEIVKGIEERSEIIPGISSIQVASAVTGIPWDELRIINLHKQPTRRKLRECINYVKSGVNVAVIPHARLNINDAIDAMMKYNLLSKEVWVLENLSLQNQNIYHGELYELSFKKYSTNSIMILPGERGKFANINLNEGNLTNMKLPGPTKEEIRVITVHKARIKGGDTVLEVGCGTGALTIEIAKRVQPDGLVYSLDLNPLAVRVTLENLRKTGLDYLVKVIQGNASDILPTIPDELDAVIIGGSKDLANVIEKSFRALRSGGRIVVNSVTLETTYTAFKTVSKYFKEVELTQVFISKSKEVKNHVLMTSYNPISIISGTKV